MWRLVEHLKGTCVYVRQELSYIGSIAARVVAVWVGGQKVSYVSHRVNVFLKCLRYLRV